LGDIKDFAKDVGDKIEDVVDIVEDAWKKIEDVITSGGGRRPNIGRKVFHQR
jgi:hypothetical protein